MTFEDVMMLIFKLRLALQSALNIYIMGMENGGITLTLDETITMVVSKKS